MEVNSTIPLYTEVYMEINEFEKEVEQITKKIDDLWRLL